MATQPPEDDELEIVEPIEAEPEKAEIQQTEDEDEEQFSIELEDEGEAEPDSAPIRQIREELKRAKAEAAELRKSLAPKAVEIGAEPNIDDEGIDYDPDKFKQEWNAWNERKNAAANQQRDAEAAQAANVERQRQSQTAYLTKAAQFQARAKITPEEFREHEQKFADQLGNDDAGMALKGLVVAGLDDAPMLAYAMSKYPKRAESIASIEDPVRKFVALVRFHDEVASKVTTKRKSPPPPEERIQGSGRISQPNADKELAKLEADAAKTGDRTKIIAFKRAQKEKSK